MERLISRRGSTVSVAVRKIETVYGTTRVLKLIRKVRPDERNSGHLQRVVRLIVRMMTHVRCTICYLTAILINLE